MKKVKALFLLLFFANVVMASEEVIMLDSSDINRLTVPTSPALDYVYSRQNEIKCIEKDDDEISFSEEDMPENKALRMFYKFVDAKAVNNKLNKFTSSMIDNIDESESLY